MGEQHSKTTQQKQSTDCETVSSLSSVKDETFTEFISSSPQKLEQISRIHKIQTSCFLKYSQSNHLSYTQTQSIRDSKEFSQLLQNIQQVYGCVEEGDHFSQCQNDKQECYQRYRNPDIDRIDSLFQKFTSNCVNNQFLKEIYHQEEQDQIQILNWKDSVNKIIFQTSKNHSYFQGHLLICGLMRLYLSQKTTLNFLEKLLHKIGQILSSNDKYIKFTSNLDAKCEQLFSQTYQKLQHNDLDFQVIYANMILGLFSNTLSQQQCLKIWYQLSICDDPFQKLQKIILSCMERIEQFIIQLRKNNHELYENCFQYKHISQILSKFTVFSPDIYQKNSSIDF